MAKPSKTQLQLVKAATQNTIPIPKSTEPNLSSKLLRFPNAEQAAALCAEQAELEFDAAHLEYHQVFIEKEALQKLSISIEKLPAVSVQKFPHGLVGYSVFNPDFLCLNR